MNSITRATLVKHLLLRFRFWSKAIKNVERWTGTPTRLWRSSNWLAMKEQIQTYRNGWGLIISMRFGN
jgi:hypothetical protein